MRLRVAFDEKRRRSARSPPKNSRPQLELPKDARYGVATLLFFFCYLEFFSPHLNAFLGFVDGWCTWVGGYLQRFFMHVPFFTSKSLESHSSVFSFPVKINARVNQTSILVAYVQGYGFKFRLPCSCFETRMQARLIRPHHSQHLHHTAAKST